MKPVSFRYLAPALLLGGLAAAAPALAVEQGDWLVRGRLIHVAPNDSSGEVSTLSGSGVAVGASSTFELDFTYMLNPNLGLELILATTKHDLKGRGTIAGLGKIGESGVLPPTLTLQYHFAPRAAVRPYAGVGMNYTLFYSDKSSASLNAALGGPTSVDLSNSWGPALQAGLDVDLTKDWFLNVDAKYVWIDTKATLATGGTTRTVNVDINPWVFGVGIGRRF
jgi:outer membrane protein